MNPVGVERIVGTWLPLALTAVVLLMDWIHGPDVQYIGVLTSMPLLAAALTSVVRTAVVSVSVLLLAFGFGYVQQAGPSAEASREAVFGEIPVATFDDPQLVRLAFIATAGVLAVLVAEARRRAANRAVRLQAVAETAQRAVMRPLPAVVGSVRCAMRYQSAARGAFIGGDLVEVLDTPYGVRAAIGDVRGKGLGAVRLSGQVLGSFREVAFTEPDLCAVACGLDRAVHREAGPEDFVTALLVEISPATPGHLARARVVACGHPSPVLIAPGDDVARTVPTHPAQPLGLLQATPSVTDVELRPDERLVLMTDGLLEARRPAGWLHRDGGEFLPADRVLAHRLSAGDVAVGLEAVVADVHRWTRGHLDDDMALLVLEPTAALTNPAGRADSLDITDTADVADVAGDGPVRRS